MRQNGCHFPPSAPQNMKEIGLGWSPFLLSSPWGREGIRGVQKPLGAPAAFLPPRRKMADDLPCYRLPFHSPFLPSVLPASLDDSHDCLAPERKDAVRRLVVLLGGPRRLPPAPAAPGKSTRADAQATKKPSTGLYRRRALVCVAALCVSRV
jgi:hypothetical protein